MVLTAALDRKFLTDSDQQVGLIIDHVGLFAMSTRLTRSRCEEQVDSLQRI